MSGTEHAGAPVFDGTVKISGWDAGRDWLLWVMLGSGAVCGALPIIWGSWLLGAPLQDSFFGMLPAMLASMILGVAGMCLPFALTQRGRAHQEIERRARLRIDNQGVSADGLAKLSWSEVLGIEPVPRSPDKIVIQTARRLKWMVQTDTTLEMTDCVRPALSYYLSIRSDENTAATVRGVVFNPWFFYGLISLGYVLGAAGAGVILALGKSNNALGTLWAAGFSAVTIASILWMPAFWRLGAFESKHG